MIKRRSYFDDWEYDEPFRPSLEVDEIGPTWTGLLDASGEPIMRYPEPIGFVYPEERD